MNEETLFHEARRKPAGERTAFLDEACGGNLALRRRIEILLQADDNPDSLFEPKPPAASAISSLSEVPGQVIGPYKLLQQLGEGGMGTVFMAEQTEPVERRVALKIIKPGMDSNKVIARFEAERQALALMDHPNIARVLDAGTTDAGRPYFVMELVKGVPITEYCDEKHLTVRQRLELLLPVCQVVQHAHQKGIIHRDIKPSNVMVALYDGRPVPKVIDFGVAKATGSRLTNKTVFTEFGQVVGTVEYMSPEQAELNQLDVDTRSDIYSLGVLLYELLTGTTPLERKRLQAAAFDEMLRIIREEEPPKPSTRLSTTNELASIAANRGLEPKRLSGLVRGELDWIVMKALEKDRSRRYETAIGLAMDIERYLGDEPVLACPPSTTYRFGKFALRNKTPLIASGLVALALVAGTVVSTWQALRANHEAEIARTQAARSEQVAQFLKNMLAGVGPWVAQGRDTTLLRDILDKTADRVGRDLNDQPEVEADLLETIGNVYTEIGPVDKAEAMQREALAIRRKLLGDEHLDVASSLHSLGFALWRRQLKPAEAESVTRESLAIRRQLLGNESWQLAGTLVQLSGALMEQGKLSDAETVARESVQLSRKLQREDVSALVWPLNFLGQVLMSESKFAEAETALREALAIERKRPVGDDLQVAETLRFIGYTLHHAGKLPEAEAVLREALAVHRKVSDPQRSPALAWTLDALADVLRAQNKFAEAEEPLRKALPIYRKVFGNQHPKTIGALNSLLDVLRQQGKQAEMEELRRDAAVLLDIPEPKSSTESAPNPHSSTPVEPPATDN